MSTCQRHRYLRRDTNNTASRTTTRITSLLRLLMSALAKIVGASMDNNGALLTINQPLNLTTTESYHKSKKTEENQQQKTYPNNTLRTNQLNQLILHTPLGIPLPICLEITQITYMAFLIAGRTVSLVVRVEMGSCRGTSIGVVAEGVDVHAALGIGVVARNVPGDGGGGRLGFLGESYGAFDVGVASEDGD